MVSGEAGKREGESSFKRFQDVVEPSLKKKKKRPGCVLASEKQPPPAMAGHFTGPVPLGAANNRLFWKMWKPTSTVLALLPERLRFA